MHCLTMMTTITMDMVWWEEVVVDWQQGQQKIPVDMSIQSNP